MNIYLNEQDAVYDLHKKGYNNDFHLFGNDLLWVQKKIFIRAETISIIECHRFCNTAGPPKEIIVFGIALVRHNVKGIMLNDYSDYTTKMPTVITKKLEELLLNT